MPLGLVVEAGRQAEAWGRINWPFPCPFPCPEQSSSCCTLAPCPLPPADAAAGEQLLRQRYLLRTRQQFEELTGQPAPTGKQYFQVCVCVCVCVCSMCAEAAACFPLAVLPFHSNGPTPSAPTVRALGQPLCPFPLPCPLLLCPLPAALCPGRHHWSLPLPQRPVRCLPGIGCPAALLAAPACPRLPMCQPGGWLFTAALALPASCIM